MKESHNDFKSLTAFIRHKQDRLIQLKKGTARSLIYGMGFRTCGSSIELFLRECAAEWEIKTSRFQEKEKKRRRERKRCRVKERDREIAVRWELPVC
jgi:heterodisulfide reductase subunit A-like polyferredoxin